MRKALAAFCLLFANVFLLIGAAHAASPSAAAIFSGSMGTTTIDSGGAIHSQTRSIYSLGGGMTSFKGKKVSLLAADPPGFSAGCSGISWHFGGFAFISMDEIRQLVEAVSQASLGVAVDLAMQTLCPQCYAVMAKLRDISNMMRNAAADACKIAQNFGEQLKKSGIFTSDARVSDCSQVKSEKAETSSFLGGAAGACKLLGDAESALKTAGAKLSGWLEGGTKGTGETPSKKEVDSSGNKTYDGLDALGYADGFVKDLLLSYIGMTIVTPVPSANCEGTFSAIYGSSKTDSEVNTQVEKILATNQTGVVKANNPSAEVAVADAAALTTPAKTTVGGASESKQVCYAPPVIEGLTTLSNKIMCGFDPRSDMETFATLYYNGDITKLSQTSLGVMCNTKGVIDGQAVGISSKDFTNPPMYHCGANSAKCTKPEIKRMKDLIQEAQGGTGSGQYTGLAWMVLDALYKGVRAVAVNAPALPPETVGIINGSGYPLYRLINMAAVYPGMADELLQAYAAIIAVQYGMDTIEKVARLGAQPYIGLKPGKGGLPAGELAQLRGDIMNMMAEAEPIREKVMNRLAQKRALVDAIVQVNKALQADVISQGLGGNADLAVSLKRQATAAGPKP